MKRKFRILFIFVPILLLSAGAFLTMTLWNWLMPALFSLGTIHFLQAAGILILARILFGFKHHHHGPMRYAFASHHCGPHSHLRKAWMHHHYEHLTPEEREKMFHSCNPKEENKA